VAKRAIGYRNVGDAVSMKDGSIRNDEKGDHVGKCLSQVGVASHPFKLRRRLLWSAPDSFFAPRSLLFLHFQRCLLFLDSKLFLRNRSLVGIRDIYGATGLEDLFARSRSLLSSVWTESRMFPSLTFPRSVSPHTRKHPCR
jgi:hypothetical protein